jgi:hypothetical protein
VRVGTAKRDAMAEEKFISRLTRTLSVSGASPERRDVQAVFAKLKAVERFLNKDDAGFLRAEFISYFSARPIDAAAARHEQKIRECVPGIIKPAFKCQRRRLFRRPADQNRREPAALRQPRRGAALPCSRRQSVFSRKKSSSRRCEKKYTIRFIGHQIS